jgi:hypothetical protein
MTLRSPAPTSVPPTQHKALFDDLCPSITWILRTSVLEWEYLSAEQKQQQTEMREAWLSGYIKPSEAILQHWLWKFLKDHTRQFAHLHKVARIMRMTAPTSPLPTLLRNSSVKAMNLPTTTVTLAPRPDPLVSGFGQIYVTVKNI